MIILEEKEIIEAIKFWLENKKIKLSEIELGIIEKEIPNLSFSPKELIIFAQIKK
jgi:hypothetical protein